LDQQAAVTSEAPDESPRKSAPEPRLTSWLFVGALLLACLLFFVLILLFILVGLGSIGVAPALVIAMTLTSRITKIRRMRVLIALGLLAFLIVVIGSYAGMVAYLLANQPVG
jgi:MFS family permease